MRRSIYCNNRVNAYILYRCCNRYFAALYARDYAVWVVVIGGVPSTLGMTMSHLLRSEGYAKHASIGLGLGVERYRASYAGSDKVYRTNYYCAFDLKFLGLSVGRKWFGFMELGYGSRGVINAGFGYRFNAKTK